MTTVGTQVHRLLDEAFAGIDGPPDMQDLKEEMRANLVVRVAELERTGLSPEAAAQRAMAELGDIRSIADEMATIGDTAPWVRNRVRPRPAYVVRTVVVSIAAAAGLAALVLPAFDLTVPLVAQVLSVAVVALGVGAIVADALRQETTTNYPVPRARALGYGVAAASALAGTGGIALWLRGQPMAVLVGGGLALLAAVVGFTYLGATQTNRHKPWVVRMHSAYPEAGDRFTQDPAAAARFGLYTVTIWIIALTGFGVLSFTVGWAWSWLALVGGFVAMMLTLARMLFVPSTMDRPA